MFDRDWTYAQALEYLNTPGPVMRWRGIIASVWKGAQADG